MRSFALVPFGAYTRILLRAHAGHIVTVMAALLMLALTLDLAQRGERLIAQSGQTSLPALVLHVGRYMVLRLADLIPVLLPLGSFMGLFWSEITLTQTRERVAVWNGGRTPLQSLAPILLIGAVLGLVQIACLGWLRPAAVGVQIAERLGSYGTRFDRTPGAGGERWIKLPDHLIRARIDYPARALMDVDLFETTREGRLTGRLRAERGEPLGDGRWRFDRGSRWTGPPDGVPDFTRGTGEARWFDTETLALPLEPLWLAWLGVDARHIPTGQLGELAGMAHRLPDGPAYRTWWHVRFAQVLLPLGMMLVASALSMMMIGQRVAFGAMMAVGLTGYFLHVSINIAVWLGEYGRIPAVVATWLVPLVLIGTGLYLMLRLQQPGRRPAAAMA
ncbi:LptF/LptG family permease [Phreatobacter sp.]|uniref:LptF/LptG family permease n=1 Tax=Phreatobacter sp. TaxID=1966341 RepID=UPI003F725E06